MGARPLAGTHQHPEPHRVEVPENGDEEGDLKKKVKTTVVAVSQTGEKELRSSQAASYA